MVPRAVSSSPGLSAFLRSLKNTSADVSLEYFISLLKRRQIKNSRHCAIATAHLLLRVVSQLKFTEVDQLLDRVAEVGDRLTKAQPRELVLGNIVRRVLGLIREEAITDRDEDASNFSEEAESAADSDEAETEIPNGHKYISSPLRQSETHSPEGAESGVANSITFSSLKTALPEHLASRPPMPGLYSSYAANSSMIVPTSMFSLLSTPQTLSPIATPTGARSPSGVATGTMQALSLAQRNLKPDIIDGINEIIDELDQVDDQIATYALEHIYTDGTVLTSTSTLTVQKYLLRAASKRKFKIMVLKSSILSISPDDEDNMSFSVFSRPLLAAGATVAQIADGDAYAVMESVNLVLLDSQAMLNNGDLIAPAGSLALAVSASAQSKPVIVLGGVYKLFPLNSFDRDSLIEHGDAGQVISYDDGSMMENIEVENPLSDYVPKEFVTLYVSNLGGHAPTSLYRIANDHYRDDDRRSFQ